MPKKTGLKRPRATKATKTKKPNDTGKAWLHKNFTKGCGEIAFTGETQHLVKPKVDRGITPFTKMNVYNVDGFTRQTEEVDFLQVFEWLMPQFDDPGAPASVSYWDWLCVQCLAYQELETPTQTVSFTPDILRRVHGCQIARAVQGMPSVHQCYDTHETLNHLADVVESLPRNLYKQCLALLHFSDEESEKGWAWHCRKFGEVQQQYCKRWQACVTPGRAITMDESRVAGWYHSGITCGPEPKPVRTGATAHTVCVTNGKFARFLLAWRIYGGRNDEGLSAPVSGSQGRGKWIQLFDELVKPWYGKGHIVTMDSAYMSEKWMDHAMSRGLNTVGTFQRNRFGNEKTCRTLTPQELKNGLSNTPFVIDDVKAMLHLQSHESMFSQREDGKITLSAWADNNLVRVASNMHDVEVRPDGVMRRTRGADG
jgi:hypothetical protein